MTKIEKTEVHSWFIAGREFLEGIISSGLSKDLKRWFLTKLLEEVQIRIEELDSKG